MIFSSLLFLTVFLPLFLAGYFIIPKKYSLKHIYLLLASFLFYAWGEPRFVFILFLTTIIDFLLVKKMDTCEEPAKRKLFVFLTVLMNVGLLFYYKYFNFFVDNVSVVSNRLGWGGINIGEIIMPIGISFYTFESITYSVDVYRKIHKPLKNFWEYQMYIIFFPKLIAGPIVRYHEIADQISSHLQNETFQQRLNGFIRFCIGLSKKVLIANVLGRQADAIFSSEPDQINSIIAWSGALAYSFQIYFDFSGYSDMAIGISKMMGFKLPENFNNPYISKSVTEFWRRWHITLGSWMKNYLYIPLGGNKAAQYRVLLNLFIVFVLSGIWHGANWNFVVWGIYYGIFLVVERLLIKKGEKSVVQQYAGLFYTFIVAVCGWVIFKLENIQQGFSFLKKMFAFDFNHDYTFIYQADFSFMLMIAALFSFCTLNGKINAFHHHFFYENTTGKSLIVFSIAGAFLYFWCVLQLSGGNFNPFIYFKF